MKKRSVLGVVAAGVLVGTFVFGATGCSSESSSVAQPQTEENAVLTLNNIKNEKAVFIYSNSRLFDIDVRLQRCKTK